MDPLKKYYFLSLAFIPFLEYFFITYLNRSFLLLYGSAGTLLFLLMLFSKDRLRYPLYLFPLILLVVYYFVWDLFNGYYHSFESGLLAYIYSNLWIHTLTFLIIVENTRFDEKFIRIIIQIFKVTILLSFIVSFVQFFIDPLFYMPDKLKIFWALQDQYEIRLNSIFTYDSSVGSSLIPIVSILIGYTLYRNERLNTAWLLLAGFVFFVNKSRYVYLNFLIILMQYPVIRGIEINKAFRVLLISVIFLPLLHLAFSFTGFDLNEFVNERLLSTSALTRFLAFEMFAEFFPKNPWFGTGLRLDDDLVRAIGGRSSQIHVGYLSHLYQFGIVGTFFLLGFLFMILNKMYSTFFYTRYSGSMFAVLCVAVTNLTGVDFSFYHYGLLFAFIFEKYISDKYFAEDNYQFV
jgi:hypothetical protein